MDAQVSLDDVPVAASLLKVFLRKIEGASWIPHGSGDVKILKKTNTSEFRIVMRGATSLRVTINHLLGPGMEITFHGSKERAMVWRTLANVPENHHKPLVRSRDGDNLSRK